MNVKLLSMVVLHAALTLSPCISAESQRLVRVRVHASGQADGNPGSQALDGNADSLWHTPWDDKAPKHPHDITIDLMRPREVKGFRYQPRSGAGNGAIKDYAFYVSDDAKDFGEPVAKGAFEAGDSEKHVSFAPKTARFVRLRALSELRGQTFASIAELRILSPGLRFTSVGGGRWDPKAPALAVRTPKTGTVMVDVTASSEGLGTEGCRAMDGDRDTVWRTARDVRRRVRHPHELTVDLGETYEIQGFAYVAPCGGGNGAVSKYQLFVGDDPKRFSRPVVTGTFEDDGHEQRVSIPEECWGRYVRLRADSAANGLPWAAVAELRLLSPGVVFEARPPAVEKQAELVELARRGHRPPGDAIEDVIDLAYRTLAFVEQVKPVPKLAAELHELEKEIGQSKDPKSLREPLCALRRRMIFSHPALDFDRLLINKRPPPGYSHMCDQYLGRHSRPGAGLVVLDSWRKKPREKVLLDGKLPAGSVLHPDLSYDGKRVLFSFCDHTEKDAKYRRFLVHEVGVNGKKLRRVTGTSNDPMECWEGRQTVVVEDFDPCYLPDGGLAFMSTRSQSFGRCHGSRYVPTYMLFRTELDGRGMRQLSFGEANEWEPSVLHDGRIVYTRWDYINRHDTIYQSLWAMAPDGTGTAHYYGNYSRAPCMTTDTRAIPGSHRVVCTAMAHHSYSAGTIITIDQRKGQDGLEPVKRITPEIGYPEAPDSVGGGSDGAFATPWPLTEDLFLVAFTPERRAGQGSVQSVNAYGIYLVDSLGGRELVYRDPNMSCFSPIPVQPRPMPPVRASNIARRPRETTGTFYLQDVHASSEEVEPGVIKRLRINRIYGQPCNGKPQLSLSNNEIIKGIVGTVPVDADGSAAFRVPAGIPLQLQALDENGMAVMTMRSLVYMQPGEVAGCVGCHEHRETTPFPAKRMASLPVHDPTPPAGPCYKGGFSFARTVQPVLDRYCIGCHGLGKTEGKLNLLGTRENGYSASHNGLTSRAGMVVIAYRNRETAISKPKDYFAHAGKLAGFLHGKHGKKSGIDRDRVGLQRIIDWLDLNAQYYGDYSRNRLEDRRTSGDDEKVLRERIAVLFGPELAAQPLVALVNVAAPGESRILNAPLAADAGGWGQIEKNGWKSTADPGYQEMQRLVEATVVPSESHDIAGTCGRTHCRCGTCWTRKIREARLYSTVDLVFEHFPSKPTVPKDAKRLPKDGWQLVRADSEETHAADAPGICAFDDDTHTYWHTRSGVGCPAHPHELVVDLGATRSICGFSYSPRNSVGDIKDCEFFVGNDPADFAGPVVRGAFPQNRSEQTVVFKVTPGRYVKLRALSSFDGSPYTAVREFSVLAVESKK